MFLLNKYFQKTIFTYSRLYIFSITFFIFSIFFSCAIVDSGSPVFLLDKAKQQASIHNASNIYTLIACVPPEKANAEIHDLFLSNHDAVDIQPVPVRFKSLLHPV